MGVFSRRVDVQVWNLGERSGLERETRGHQALESDQGKKGTSQVAVLVKNLPASAGDIRDAGLIPGSGRSPGGGNGRHFSEWHPILRKRTLIHRPLMLFPP